MPRSMVIGMSLLAALGAFAQINPPPTISGSPSVAELVARLGADDWKVRDEAHRLLLESRSANLLEIEAALANPNLTPEQRHRLMLIGRQRFAIEPRAAMGIQFEGMIDGGVMIRTPLRDFDSFNVLEPGDTVLSMDGVRTRTQDDLRFLIVSHDPGDGVVLSILRGGQPMEIALTLGNYNMLQNRANLDDATLFQAWAVRLRRKGLIEAEPDVVWTGLSPQAWEEVARGGDLASPDSAIARNQDLDTFLVVGGEPVAHFQPLVTRPGSRVRGGSRVVVIQPRLDADNATPAAQIAALNQRAEELRVLQQAAAMRVASLQRQVGAENLPEVQRQAIEIAYRDAVSQLQLINRELAEVNQLLVRLRSGR